MSPAKFRLVIALSAAPLLGGCVAALVPIAAGGALLGKGQPSGHNDKQIAADDGKANQPIKPEVIVESRTAGSAATRAELVSTPSSVETTPAGLETREIAVSEGSAMAELPLQSLTPTAGKPTAELPIANPVSASASATLVVSSSPAQPLAFPPATAQPKSVATAFDFPQTTLVEPVPRAVEPAGTAPATPVPFTTPLATPAPVVMAASKAAPSTARLAPAYGPLDLRAYDSFYSYVDSQARKDPIESPRQSALLAAPGTLNPIRTDCSIRPPAVLIDLDPGDGAFDPDAKAQPNPALSQLLRSLRLQDIDIFWISELSAIKAGGVRNALISSGMDPEGRDGLLLMRRIDDRKQIRREELAETHCLLAIAGDSRADFDELYVYLKDKSAAQPLESLIGAGWFITPLPLSPENPVPEG
ncbi:MAG: hypothetical protein WAT93_00035 [Pontixanthobacter sp.]